MLFTSDLRTLAKSVFSGRGEQMYRVFVIICHEVSRKAAFLYVLTSDFVQAGKWQSGSCVLLYMCNMFACPEIWIDDGF